MESNLKFLSTMSIEEFKSKLNVDKIEIKRSEQTGKCFFVYGGGSGPCSRKADVGELTNPVISQVCSADTGDMFYMLHQRGEGGAVTLAVL